MDFLPMPHSVRKGEGFFVLRYDTRIVLENTEPSAFLYAQMLQEDIHRAIIWIARGAGCPRWKPSSATPTCCAATRSTNGSCTSSIPISSAT